MGFSVPTKHLVLLGLLLSLPIPSIAQPASSSERQIQRQNLARWLTPDKLDLSQHPPTDQAHWRQVLWSLTLLQPTDPAAQASLEALLTAAATPQPASDLQPTLQAVLRTSAALYNRPLAPNNRTAYGFIPDKLKAILTISRDPALLALALSIMGQSGSDPTPWISPIKNRLALWYAHPQLRTTLEDLGRAPQTLPPLGDLLNYQLTSLPQLYVLCRPNRAIACLTLLKDGQGKFLRRQDTSLWSLNLLARSVYPLAWNFNSGETPQGLMRLEGTIARGPLEFRAFGQFPSVKVFLPFEPGASEFAPGLPKTTPLDLGMYRSQWPQSWQDYRPIEESFWAGRIGRNLIRIHGSGEDPAYYYPTSTDLPNLTIGCIAALEQYGPDGQLLRADLPLLLEAWNKIQPSGLVGYLWLVEVPGPDTPVPVTEIAPLLL